MNESRVENSCVIISWNTPGKTTDASVTRQKSTLPYPTCWSVLVHIHYYYLPRTMGPRTRQFSSLRRILVTKPQMKRTYWRAYRLSTSKGKRLLQTRQLDLCRKAEIWFNQYALQVPPRHILTSVH